jgi:AcrR family transcriptional regulator
MGIKERRDRERQELKQAILGAAREIAAREGWQAVTIRKVADRIEYSPPTIYEHFANKDAILIELMREGFRLLLATIQATAGADAASRMIGICRGYWEFAWTYPELYQVMHGLGGVPFCLDETAAELHGRMPEAKAVFEATAQVVRELPGLAQASALELDETVHVIWATLHGLVALTMSGRIEGGPAQAMRLVERAARDFLAARRVLAGG